MQSVCSFQSLDAASAAPLLQALGRIIMTKRPFKFRAVHKKNRWRKATHESFENATSVGKRSAKALFKHGNDAVDYSVEGEPLYVVIWNGDEVNGDGIVVKQNTSSSSGLLYSSPVPRSKIEIWEKSRKKPENSELETFFESQLIDTEQDNVLTIDQCETDAQVEIFLSNKIAQSFNDSRELRLKRISESDPNPKQMQVSTSVFTRNPDVIVEVLLRANGVCEECGENAPFVRKRDGSPYLEVHHILPLSEGGDDTISNAVALCPNCHRFFHHGKKP